MTSRKILVIDDHATLRRVLSSHLIRCGHQVVGCISLEDAFWAASGDRFDVILCDLQLPDGDGCEFAEIVKHREVVPILIAMSALPAEESRVRSLSAGFHHFLSKPFLPDDLDPLLVELR